MVEDMARDQISALLPDALAKAVTSYRTFSQNEKENLESKAFAAHHAACKAAAAHIELLLKLARQVNGKGTDGGNDEAVLEAMMAMAEEEVARYHAGQY